MADSQDKTSERDTDDVKIWKNQALQLQTEFYKTYGDKVWWSGLPKSNVTELQYLIGSVIYGPSPNEAHTDLRKCGYTRREALRIRLVSRRIVMHFQGETTLSVIFICAKTNKKSKTRQVFRVWDADKEVIIDTSSRMYKDWASFLTENKFPRCLICFPTNGRYEFSSAGVVNVEFAATPACRTKKRVLFALDLIAVVLILASFITHIVMWTSGVSNVVKIVANLVVLVVLPFRLIRLGIRINDIRIHT